MTVTGVVVAVIVRKFRALVAEIRTLVNEVKQAEIVIFRKAKAEVATLKEELVVKIAKL